jgi:hypothetical protein
MALVNLIYSIGLTFSLTSEPTFWKVLTLARTVGSCYQVPSCNQISNESLDLNYEQYKEKYLELLSKEAEVFGLT